jgi:RNA polymerase sigma factor (TIGR02999 family)
MNAGEPDVLDQLFPLVYAELRRAADMLLNREFEAHTLQPTALVHEAYLKLVRGGAPDATSKAHFLGIAARAMRQILVDHARRRKAAKRGKGEAFVTLGDHADEAVAAPDADTMIALDEALADLSKMDLRLARVVELRFFGGLTEEQIAATLGVTSRTVQRDWAKARAWLHARIAAES